MYATVHVGERHLTFFFLRLLRGLLLHMTGVEAHGMHAPSSTTGRVWRPPTPHTEEASPLAEATTV